MNWVILFMFYAMEWICCVLYLVCEYNYNKTCKGCWWIIVIIVNSTFPHRCSKLGSCNSYRYFGWDFTRFTGVAKRAIIYGFFGMCSVEPRYNLKRPTWIYFLSTTSMTSEPIIYFLFCNNWLGSKVLDYGSQFVYGRAFHLGINPWLVIDEYIP